MVKPLLVVWLMGEGEKKRRGNLMLKLCGAKAKINKYEPCNLPAMDNGRCRLHGGLTPRNNPGAKTEAGKLRQKMGSWKHGLRSKEVIDEKRAVRGMIKECKDILDGI